MGGKVNVTGERWIEILRVQAMRKLSPSTYIVHRKIPRAVTAAKMAHDRFGDWDRDAPSMGQGYDG